MNLYNVLISIFEEKLEDKENTKDIKDLKNIKDVIEKYNVLPDIKNISIQFGYSNLALTTSENLESIEDSDFSNIPKDEEEEQKEEQKEKFTQITNKNVFYILKYIKRKIENFKIQNKPKGNELPFIIKISWNFGSIRYSLEVNIYKEKMNVYSYEINNSKHQEGIINNFITERRKIIKNSPFRLLGSIFVFNDWFYGWDKKKAIEGLESRKIKK